MITIASTAEPNADYLEQLKLSKAQACQNFKKMSTACTYCLALKMEKLALWKTRMVWHHN